MFIAVVVPFLILTTTNGDRSECSAPRSPARCSGFADDYTKIVRRRSLGLRGAHEARRDDRDLARPLVRGAS